MGEAGAVEEAKMICGIIASDAGLAERAESSLAAAFGPIELRSETFPFDFTGYYEKEMGRGLVRKFVLFAGLMDPSSLAETKLKTNCIEREYAETAGDGMRRRVNLDPGYITAAKLVLATTKNFSHRVYLRNGIYAEITLNFRKDGCSFFDWTYPDFKSGRYTPFLLEARRRFMTAAAQNGR